MLFNSHTTVASIMVVRNCALLPGKLTRRSLIDLLMYAWRTSQYQLHLTPNKSMGGFMGIVLAR